MPELGERGYCSSDEESVFSSDAENEPRRTRRRGVFDDTPPGRIGTAVLDAFPPLTVRAALPCFRGPLMSPPKGGESVADNPEITEVAAARIDDDAGANTASPRSSTRLMQREGNDAAPPAQAASMEERSGAEGAAAAGLAAAAEGSAAAEEDNTIRAAPVRRRQ